MTSRVDREVDQRAECTDTTGGVDRAGLVPEVERAVSDSAAGVRARGLAEAVRSLLKIGRVDMAQPLVNELVELLTDARGQVADVIPIRRRDR